jgi:DNA-directed RNA polymerase specialized sigma24 family protein
MTSSVDSSALPSLSLNQQLTRMLKKSYQTLSALPGPAQHKLRTYWPYVDYGGGVFRARPSSHDIEALDIVLQALTSLDNNDRKLLWARAGGVSWKKICGFMGLSRTTVTKQYNKALGLLAQKLLDNQS